MSSGATTHRNVSAALLVVGSLALGTIVLTQLTWIPAPDVAPGLAEEYFDAQHLERVQAYTSRARVLSWSSLVVGTALLCAAALWARSARAHAVFDRRSGPWWVGSATAVLALLAVQRIVTLPFGFLLWRHRVEFGLAPDDALLWASDVARGWALSSALTLVVVLLVLGCRRRWREWWPVAVALFLATGVALGSFVYPVLVEPLSHDFTTLPAGALRTGIEEMAETTGVQIGDVVVADASQRTSAMNAWISGLGPTRRVVLYDTIVEDAPREAVLAVVAHEMAHARFGHVEKGTALGAAAVVTVAGLLGLALGPGCGRGRRPEQSASLAVLLVALMALGVQASAPAQSGISRVMEREADRAALEMTGENAAYIDLQVLLARRSLSDPEPPQWSHFWWGTHPTAMERIMAVS